MCGTACDAKLLFFKIVDFMESRYKSNTSDKNLVSELRCILRVKCTLNFEDIIWKRECKISY